MKLFFFIFFSFMLLSWIESISSIKKNTFFEGEIHYAIDYAPYDADQFSAKNLKERIGSTLIQTFKDGNFKKEFFSPDGELLHTRALNLKRNKSYSWSPDSDTVFWLDITKKGTLTTIESIADSSFLNHPCVIIHSKSTVSGPGLGSKTFQVSSINAYAKDLAVNPAWYFHFEEGNFNEIVKKARGIAIYSNNKGIYWEQKIQMNSIISRTVKDSELTLKIPKNAPFKEL